METCSECNKKLGWLSPKYKSGYGTFQCFDCHENHKKQLKENDKKIMTEYITKYLSSKDMEISVPILLCHENKNIRDLFEKHSLQKVIERFEIILGQTERTNKSGMSSYEIDDSIDSKKTYEDTLDFLADMEKMYKLFKKKNIDTDYKKILSVFAEISQQNINDEYDKILTPVYKRICKKLGSNPTVENIVKEFVTTPIDAEPSFDNISRLLDKFSLKYNKEKVEKIIEKVLDDIEIDEFERDFGSAKIDIGDFEKLSGYEFESYLKNLFTLLGYTVVQTSLSGDQGADLIISKDGEKSVVQTKKYTGNVSNGAVQEIVAAKNHYKAQKAIVVTNSSFTKSAIELALSNDVELWDGLKLNNVIQRLQKKKNEKGFALDKTYSLKGKGVQKIEIKCPFCEEEFECDVDAANISNFKIDCPNCELEIEATGTTITWNCEHCSKQFSTKDECEKHEKICSVKD